MPDETREQIEHRLKISSQLVSQMLLGTVCIGTQVRDDKVIVSFDGGYELSLGEGWNCRLSRKALAEMISDSLKDLKSKQ